MRRWPLQSDASSPLPLCHLFLATFSQRTTTNTIRSPMTSMPSRQWQIRTKTKNEPNPIQSNPIQSNPFLFFSFLSDLLLHRARRPKSFWMISKQANHDQCKPDSKSLFFSFLQSRNNDTEREGENQRAEGSMTWIKR